MNTMESRIKTVLDIFEGNIKESDAALKHNVTESEIQEWKTFYTASIRHAINSKQWELPGKSGRKRVRVAAIIGALLILGTAAAVAGPADIIQCTDNDYFFCFSPNTPAKASEVNHNFVKMADWVEKAVGPIDAPALSTADGTTTLQGALEVTGDTQVTGALTADSTTVTNALLADSATVTNALTAGSASVSGNFEAGSITGPTTVTGELAGVTTATATCPIGKKVVFAVGWVNDYGQTCSTTTRDTRCSFETILTNCLGQNACAYTGEAHGCSQGGNTCVYALCM